LETAGGSISGFSNTVFCSEYQMMNKVYKPGNSKFKAFSDIYPEDNIFKHKTEKILNIGNVTEKLNVWDHRHLTIRESLEPKTLNRNSKVLVTMAQQGSFSSAHHSTLHH
jgi:hypothetical protein